jgi:hypothetical protein
MNRSRFGRHLALSGLLAVFGAASAKAAQTNEPLALVPAEAATVGVIHWNELRASPLGARVFAEMDRISTDGDAARFLEETKISPREDVDTIVVSMSRSGDRGGALVLFEGRFDLDRIARALVERGAELQTTANGPYYRLKEGRHSSGHSGHSGKPGAVALLNRHLVVAGTEPDVVAALERREKGGAGGLASGGGLGRQLSRIRPDATAWALVDLTRFPSTQGREAHVDVHSDAEDGPARAILGTMKSVSLLAIQASVRGDTVEVSATGLTADAENRSLLEDSLRGVLAMWRLAVQDKSPELVPVLRGFRVTSDPEGVSIDGTLPGSLLRSLSARNRSKS